jgi:hypothetical protein
MTRKFLLTFSLFLLSTVALAESGAYYNPDRSGEGIFLTIDKDNRLAFAMFTYWDGKNAVRPTVSPEPPYDPAVLCKQCPIWYNGQGLYLDEVALGSLYLSLPIDYPNVVNGHLNEVIKVGEWLIVPNKSGFDLVVECNSNMHPDMYICNNAFTFVEKLIGE